MTEIQTATGEAVGHDEHACCPACANRLMDIERKVDALDTFLRETVAGIAGGVEAVMGNGIVGRILGRGRSE